MWTYALWLVPVVLAVPLTIFVLRRFTAARPVATEAVSVYDKKYASLKSSRYRAFLANVGMVVSLSFVIWAFGFKVYDNNPPYIDEIYAASYNPDEVVKATLMKKPLPPKPKVTSVVEIIEVEEDKPDEDLIDIIDDTPEDNRPTDATYSDLPIAADVAPAPSLPEPDIDEVRIVASDMPEPIGGMAAYMAWLAKNMKYPEDMKRIDIQGKVYASFVVDKDGSITQVKIIKGLHKSADEEVIRLLNKSPKWTPGRQSGRPVKVRMTLPFSFRLR